MDNKKKNSTGSITSKVIIVVNAMKQTRREIESIINELKP